MRRAALLAVLASGALCAPAGAHEAAPMLGSEATPATNPFAGAQLRAAARLRAEPPQLASPRATCGPGSRPEPGMQGRVPASAYASGDADQGYRCNLSLTGREGTQGGFKVERYVDRAGHDPGAASPAQGYAGHYCSVPRAVDPGIVACSFIASGLRVFDIRDPYAAKEFAYFVAPPGNLGGAPVSAERSNYAMSKPAFDEENGEIWYTDGNSGFYALKLENGTWPMRESTTGIPSGRTCLSRRAFTVRLRAPRGTRLRSATVSLDGKRIAVRRAGGRLTARVDLRGRQKRTVRLVVRARTTSGKLVRESRAYRTCTRRF